MVFVSIQELKEKYAELNSSYFTLKQIVSSASPDSYEYNEIMEELDIICFCMWNIRWQLTLLHIKRLIPTNWFSDEENIKKR